MQARKLSLTFLIPTILSAPLLAQDEAPQPPHVLVLVEDGGSSQSKTLALKAAECLTEHFQNHRYFVVDEEQARLLSEKNKSILRRWTGGEELPEQRLARLSYADIVVQLSVGAGRERKQQGRYRVTFPLKVKMTGAQDAQALLGKTFRARGSALEGYPQAQDKALERLCDTSDQASFAVELRERLEAFHQEEKEKGSLCTVVLYDDDGITQKQAAVFAEKLREKERVATESLVLVNSGSLRVNGEKQRSFAEYQLRYRGPNWRLRGDTYNAIQELLTPKEEEQGVILDPAFITQRRRIDVLIRRRVPEVSVREEIEKQVEQLVASVYKNHQGYLEEKSIAVLPTVIPASEGPSAKVNSFARAYWAAFEGVERKASQAGQESDPLQQGPVNVEGQTFETLKDARNHGKELLVSFQTSDAGRMSSRISELIAKALEVKSGGKIKVLPGKDLDLLALDVIKYEAELYREEGAIQEDTIKFFERPGAQTAVVSSLDTLLDDYQLRLVLMDLETGAMILEHVFLAKQFKEGLDKILRT